MSNRILLTVVCFFMPFLILAQCCEEMDLSHDLGIKGKVDVGPAYLHIDVLDYGKTVKQLDLPAVKADVNVALENGITLKPTFLYGSNRGGLLAAGLALGQYIPLTDDLQILPNVGFSFCKMWTTIDLPDFGLFDLREKFRSISPFLAIEAYYSFAPTWRVCGSVQYAWSRTHTIIRHLTKAKSRTEGPNYSLLLEKDVTPAWSMNIGMGYNISLSKEKHGLRGTGVKLGVGRWF